MRSKRTTKNRIIAIASNAERNSGVLLKISSHRDTSYVYIFWGKFHVLADPVQRDIQIHGWTSLSCRSEAEARRPSPSFLQRSLVRSSFFLSFLSRTTRRHRSLVSVSPTSVCPRRNERKLEARKKGERA